jgi:hypothetical protein
MVNDDLKRASEFDEPHDDVTVAPGLRLASSLLSHVAQKPLVRPAETGDFHD